MKSFSFHTRLSGPGTSHENTSCNIVFRSLLHENYMKFSQNFQVGGAHTPGGSLRGFLPSLLDRRSASRRGCRGICSGRLMGMCLRCARCSTVSLKTLPEKVPRRFHFRSKFQVKTFQVEIFARTLGGRPTRIRASCRRGWSSLEPAQRPPPWAAHWRSAPRHRRMSPEVARTLGLRVVELLAAV